MPKILKSPEATADLLEIGQFIAEQSGSERTAIRLLDSIDEKCKFLARHPYAAEARPDLAPKVRVSPVGNYVVIYRPMKGGIELLRVMRGSRDIPAVFRKGRSD